MTTENFYETNYNIYYVLEYFVIHFMFQAKLTEYIMCTAVGVNIYALGVISLNQYLEDGCR